eukprot:363340-Chlamydomonas_euryale.AAC.11
MHIPPQAARKKASSELGRSTEERATIHRELDALEALLQSGDALQTALRNPLPDVPAPGGRSAAGTAAGGGTLGAGCGSSGRPEPLSGCKQVLSSLDALRFKLVSQARLLEFLASKGLRPAPVSLDLDADGEQEPAAAAGGGSDGAAEAAAAEASSREPLARGIEAVVDASLAEIGEVARAYYATLFAPSAAGKKPASAKKGAAKV